MDFAVKLKPKTTPQTANYSLPIRLLIKYYLWILEAIFSVSHTVVSFSPKTQIKLVYLVSRHVWAETCICA